MPFYAARRRPSTDYINTGGKQKEELELPLFDLATVSEATNNFSEDNKLGKGGFGSVYKVKLQFLYKFNLEIAQLDPI